jgi:hypothetical protein
MSNDASSRFAELKTFAEHLEKCDECQTKLSLNEIYGEILAHEAGSNEEKNKNKILMEV